MGNLITAGFAAMVLSAAVWATLYSSAFPPDVRGQIDSLSYNFAAPDERTLDEKGKARLATVGPELEALARITDSVRLYAASGVYEGVPEIARKHGLSVIAGAWVGDDSEFSKLELDSAIRMVNRNTNVRSIVVGNETILREELTTSQLTEVLRHVRQRVRVPVTTGETWDVWLEYPELVGEVDYIAAHILPYWEGVPPEQAVDYAFARYEDLRDAYPGKRIVISEFGWPSQGYNNRSADTGRLIQAKVLRQFIVEAERRGIAYNIIEAIDQPWKTNEGSVGPYWGILNAGGEFKFPFEGIAKDPSYILRAALGIGLGVLVSLFALRQRKPTFAQALMFMLAAQALAAGMSLALLYPVENYLNVGSAIAWGVGMLLMLPLTAITLVKAGEVAEVVFGRAPCRLIESAAADPIVARHPKVSIHIPAYREPPGMLIETLNSVAGLHYPAFEVLVIVNNTPDPAFWEPIKAHCEALGERFKFVFLPAVAGFKAGALNAAAPQMADDAEIIALIDADYVVHPDWLAHLVPAFDDPKIGFVQAPQDHRDGFDSMLKQVMNSEYAGFFDIGMVQRNEDDAIITHGTMLLLRREAFEAVGAWEVDTITEDTELGLRLLAGGYSSLYTNRRYGWGLLPDTYRAFQKQRHRWAFGAAQIVRKHWRLMLPRRGPLTSQQKFQFVTGWSYWFSDSLGVIAAYLNLMWVPMILFVGVLIPTLPFTVPILAAFFVNLLHVAMLYRMRVKLPRWQIPGAALAAMSLQFTVACAVIACFLGKRLGFLRTEKGGLAALIGKSGDGSPARVELITGVCLVLAASALYATNTLQTLEITIFATTLLIQSLPFIAAPLMYALERSALPAIDPGARRLWLIPDRVPQG
jgi:cellulose synthase/poly-beta-1,6-N-acetylglucosamine synthase-like glycosyltransferase/exo-beta-1,3-glucanase (GH17 family)